MATRAPHYLSKADELLETVLPRAAADEIRTTGSVIPRRYDDVAVLFCDLVGSTRIASHLDPEDYRGLRVFLDRHKDAPHGILVTRDLYEWREDVRVLVMPDGREASFPIDGFAQHCLLNGIDQLGYILSFEDAIKRYEGAHA